ncbi:KdsC family phosphatase [Negadavirga shengliensis]|uniref:3-deoxy-D-manno-octulosonate 8-phosphate phosphatase KdsC n=1 Tax=Negadavirga shengliensis TaxID=1389218 RepID=A0ABV9SUU3_9BACT
MTEYLKAIDHEIVRKAQRIKILVSDLDGVMTDGGIIMDDRGVEYKRFQVKDGQIVAYLKQHGIRVGIISGRNVPVAAKRCEQMGVDFHHHGVRDKLAMVRELVKAYGYGFEQCAYIGDDLIDIALLAKVGLSAAPADAMPYVRERVDFITSKKGGEGAFREVADLILLAQGKMESVIRSCIQ